MRDFDEARASAAALFRPFFFMVPFWGERYRQYFVNILLPSLLSPNNLSLLRADEGHKFLIATTTEDWNAIIDLPVVKRLREHATPTLIKIKNSKWETTPGSTSAIFHQNVAQKLLVSAAYQARAYGVLFSPDCIISDGTMTSLIRHALNGRNLVLCPALRQSEELVVAELTRLGYLSPDSPSSEGGAPISVPPRVLAELMVRHLHPDMAIFQEGAPGQPPLAPFRYWRLSRNKGIILHTFHGAPMLMNYAVIDHHDVACLERGLFEDVYVARNFGAKGDFHVVEDSDEFCILSLTPIAVSQIMSAATLNATAQASSGLASRLLAALAVSYCTAGLPLKKELFKHSVRWHGSDLDAAAIAEERQIAAFVDSAVRYSRWIQLPATLFAAYRNTRAVQWFLPFARILVKVLVGDHHTWSVIREGLAFQIKRPFKRAVFWFASGKDLDRIDPWHLSFRRTTGRVIASETLFAASPTSAVILGIGQSNIANEGDVTARYEPKGEVYNFNFFDGKCYVAKDPLLGASINRSNVLTRVGEHLVERGDYRRVLLVPIAHGGTFAEDWSPKGRVFPRLQWTLQRLREQQIGVTHILWQQGEAEAAEAQPDAGAWMRHFMATVGAIRDAGCDAPIYVAQCTVCCSDPNETIRAAQRNVVDPVAGVLAGPDIDQVRSDERYDGCHLSADGLRHAAELWYDTLCRTR